MIWLEIEMIWKILSLGIGWWAILVWWAICSIILAVLVRRAMTASDDEYPRDERN